MVTRLISVEVTTFYRTMDKNKEMATLFFRVQNKEHKIYSIFSSQIQVDVQDWRNAISYEENWMRHREKNFKLHDTLAKIEITERKSADLDDNEAEGGTEKRR